MLGNSGCQKLAACTYPVSVPSSSMRCLKRRVAFSVARGVHSRLLPALRQTVIAEMCCSERSKGFTWALPTLRHTQPKPLLLRKHRGRRLRRPLLARRICRLPKRWRDR
jgi:hypothetical protein